MPYIKANDRIKALDNGAEVPGDLAYLIYCLVLDWARKPDGNLSYTKASHAIGVLETVKHEFARKHLDPYEDIKLEENGDVDAAEAKYVAGQLRRIKSFGGSQEVGSKQSSGL